MWTVPHVDSNNGWPGRSEVVWVCGVAVERRAKNRPGFLRYLSSRLGSTKGIHQTREDHAKRQVTFPASWPSAPSPPTTAPSFTATRRSNVLRVCASTSPPRITPGSAERMKTPTGSSANICQSVAAWPRSLSTTAMSSPTNSTPGQANDSTIKLQRSASMETDQRCASKLKLGDTTDYRGTSPSEKKTSLPCCLANDTISSAPAEGPPILRHASHFATSRLEMG